MQMTDFRRDYFQQEHEIRDEEGLGDGLVRRCEVMGRDTHVAHADDGLQEGLLPTGRVERPAGTRHRVPPDRCSPCSGWLLHLGKTTGRDAALPRPTECL